MFSELNWIAKREKGIAQPLVVFENIDAGGYYYNPEKGEILLNEKYYPLDKGLIVVDVSAPEEIVNTISHEWRHHIQFINGIEMEVIEWDNDIDNYEQNIIDYFTRSWTEMDALLYSNKYAPTECTLTWQQWIFKNNNRFIKYARQMGINY
jgi:hypothetical protein